MSLFIYFRAVIKLNKKMKKITTALVLISSLFAFAQEESKTNDEKTFDFNRWSIDINGGISRPTAPFTVNNYVPDFSPYHVDLGLRYMFTTKVGLKLDLGYDNFKEAKNSQKFEGKYSRIGLQGVLNLGRALNFEDFSEKLNLQLHAGFGYAYLESNGFSGKDEMTYVPIGLTAQYKISNRIAFNADFTMINNISQHYTFDGKSGGVGGYVIEDRGFNSTLYNATVGISIYLGKNENHADWTVYSKKDMELLATIDSLQQRVDDIETMMNDTDRDGVVDYLDVEPNTINGVAVDTKGRSIDNNNNGVPDELETYIQNNNKQILAANSSNGYIKELINGGYVNVYFDTNSTKLGKESMGSINFVVKYLNENPSESIDIFGYADDLGNTEYNKSLSERRATAVKNLIEKAGINASRLNINALGEDSLSGSKSKDARSFVRKVTFKLK